ncbi:EcpB family pilus assembly chaperone [Enterobacillus tribolii]|uniref:Probable fimbrial chaperone EcpB n=1 Tax=Enterobacillus tribolii TaxID=1487935 RepID=A0A370QEG1_9GAMM|nr:hypothetical protein [Enterobacillus tribolii]MBW7984184.1 hypothetical protein [Enterobacillus tribolii]RDK86755.1 hypothetical protein C8D90_11029 [Enterobacillus tribolii]
MKIKSLLTVLIPLLAPFSAQAINVGDVTSMMSPGSSNLAKEISNTTDMARYVSISVERISSPMAGGVVIPMESKSELLSTPASLILPGSAKENVRFFYRGPEDDKERYYRLSWTDEPVMEYDANKNARLGQATTSAIISTILVVAPRKERFEFKYQNGTVTNTGNASFRVISYGPCRDKTKDTGQGCRERYYLMPGIDVKIKHTDLSNSKTRIGIWHDKKYINVN